MRSKRGRRFFDQPKHDPAETIVAPVGTKITVDISEENPPRNVSRSHTGRVINIVQVGSTVAIPALSKVTIQHSVGTMELTDVTIDGVHYKLQTDRVTLEDGSMSEATFTLTKALTIKREAKEIRGNLDFDGLITALAGLLRLNPIDQARARFPESALLSWYFRVWRILTLPLTAGETPNTTSL
jgi:hypothetical protein